MLAIPVLAALVLLTACGQGSASAPELKLTSDDAFETAVGSVWDNGGSRCIADLTDFEWDGLRIFAEGTPAAMINSYVGGEVIRRNYYESSANLLVFTHGGEPARLLMMSGDFLTRDRPDITYGPAVRLTVDPPGGGLAHLEDSRHCIA
ncbi:hypothetical protein K1T35_47785 (plasmid) [Pseudonocardia sp. DSM 110487]|uniref:hypothetical protein n=1 Tax=Pseudonocardia sp. DSM 110487 TaxID=2865833 RepID=UPI001C6991DE|nr:hypothetical protein [Pseudonocardia sp. DSM 110487]QYN41053.1 hypothetical protein K1T35_47785 [Pseudonocardia sp. DSM 110487]